MQSVYEAAGDQEGLLRLAHAWHARVMADPVMSMTAFEDSAEESPDGLPLPRWSWDGLQD